MRRVYRRITEIRIPKKEVIGSRPSRKEPSSHPDLFRPPRFGGEAPKPDVESHTVIKPHPKRRGIARRKYARLLRCPKIPRGEGKTCAIVGNASSILTQFVGDNINACDVVVRINDPKIILPECQGNRTDILYCTNTSLKMLHPSAFQNYTVVSVHDHLSSYFHDWSEILRNSVDNPKARPSTGFIAIAHMTYLGYDVSIFGFDWFKTPTIQRMAEGNIHWEHHIGYWEEQMVNELIQHKFR